MTSTWLKFLELIRFSHTVFALPFALLAAVMAWVARARAEPPLPWRIGELVGIVLCMVFARSAAMAFNRIADRKIDAANPRTAGRHLPTGSLSVRSVVGFTVACSAGFIASTLLFLPNRWPLILSPFVLAFLMGYSYAKRFTALAHFWLGTALFLAPVATWIALIGRVDAAPVVLGAAVLLWVAGFDIIYACQDVGFDVSARLRSIPAWLGVARALRVSAACHAGSVVLLALVPLTFPGLGGIYGWGIAGIAVLLAYEHWLVRPDDLSRVNLAFFHINWVISLVVLVTGMVDLLA